MSATDELRRLLDERGVEHFDLGGNTHIEPTEYGLYQYRYHAVEIIEGAINLYIHELTPEQAIAAMLLGTETCHNVAGMEDVFECSACGGRYISWELRRWARYCPDCGKRVS